MKRQERDLKEKERNGICFSQVELFAWSAPTRVFLPPDVIEKLNGS